MYVLPIIGAGHNLCSGNKELPLQRRQPDAEAVKRTRRDPENRPRGHGSYSTREDRDNAMLQMNGRISKGTKEHSSDPVIQVLGQQQIIKMLSNGDALRELESIEKYVYSRMQKNEIRGFLDMTVEVFALGYIYGKREERSRKASARRSGSVPR